MREILFRGKRIDNGEWIEGNYYKSKISGVFILEPYIRKKDGGVIVDAFNIHRVAPITVGQYTGLLDKNGKRIFEGDMIYSIYTRKNYPVVFGEYGFDDDYGIEERACGWFNKEDNGYESPIGRTEDWAVIVGNIHDNPELLEGNT